MIGMMQRVQNHNLEKSKYAVQFINVGKTFHSKQKACYVLNHMSFKIQTGKITAILGTSGAGKTTTARIINGLENYERRKVFVNGSLLSRSTESEIRKHTAFVFQTFNLFPHLSILENIIYTPINVYKKDKASTILAAKALLKKFNLGRKADAYPHELSGGQKQRVAII